ncbi:hypothetical protein Tco_0838775 [Tanacetum coccineum]|uniref:Uncharacterized protein n=1 Tax=Tanacetum coccineum TaxID=301880 RepID=A0ABQ5APP3_9ASTR
MDSEPNDVRLSILRRLREDFEAEVALANKFVGHVDSLTTGADMRNTNNLVAARNELLRSIAEKEEFSNNYRAM